jgi:CO/xanthine dehydrogenase Mo-binding subunit
LGGGFGGKLMLIEPLAAAAALATGRPVMVAFTRSEDFAAANPCSAFVMEVEVGAAADGTFAAIDARVVADNGAFTDYSSGPLVGGRLPGPYRFGTARITSYGVRTNRFGAGAYRGPTGLQCALVLETLIDELALELRVDPIELRLMNLLRYGDPKLDGTAWPSTGVAETLDAMRDHPLWAQRASLPAGEGIGLAVGMFPGGKMGAAAGCRMDTDGGFTLLSGYIDMSGTDTAVTAIAAEVLGIEPERVRIVTSDTNSAPHAGVSGGSMVTYCLGNAVRAAAEDARDQIVHLVASDMEIDPEDLELVNGTVRPRGAPQLAVPLEQIAARVTGFGTLAPIEGHGRINPPELSPSAAVALAHVRVDAASGEVELVRYVAAQDVGRAINPSLCEGQMRGGAVQSIGVALQEQLEHDDDGQLLTASFQSYALPKMDHVPDIETIIVEVPAPHGPLGARGMGESAIVPGAAAIVNAVAAATGERFRDLPLTSQRVWRRLSARDAGDARTGA